MCHQKKIVPVHQWSHEPCDVGGVPDPKHCERSSEHDVVHDVFEVAHLQGRVGTFGRTHLLYVVPVQHKLDSRQHGGVGVDAVCSVCVSLFTPHEYLQGHTQACPRFPAREMCKTQKIRFTGLLPRKSALLDYCPGPAIDDPSLCTSLQRVMQRPVVL